MLATLWHACEAQSIHMFVCMKETQAPMVRIHDIGELCEEFLSNFNFNLDQTISTATLLGEPDTFLCVIYKTFNGVKNVPNDS
jgi:hypothetical protein